MLYFWSRSAGDKEKYLSNFTKCPVALDFHGAKFWSVEHAYQAAKFLYTVGDKGRRYFASFAADGEIGQQPANVAKSRGGKTHMKKVFRCEVDNKKWNGVRAAIMKSLIAVRFRVDDKFRKILLEAVMHKQDILHFERPSRGKELFWGGYFPADKERSVQNFVGHNVLGKIMQEIALQQLVVDLFGDA